VKVLLFIIYILDVFVYGVEVRVYSMVMCIGYDECIGWVIGVYYVRDGVEYF